MTPQKRARVSYCELDLLDKLTLPLDLTPNHTPKPNKLLALLTYGEDVNVEFGGRMSRCLMGAGRALTWAEGEVNCDPNPHPLHHHHLIRRRMIDQGELLVRLLTSVGLDINCPKIGGDLDPLLLEEVKQSFAILRVLTTAGTDTNSVSEEHHCEFCDKLKYLQNFGAEEEEEEEEDAEEEHRSLVLNALLACGSEVNSVKCSNKMLFCPHEENQGDAGGGTQALAQLLVTNGHKVNCFPQEPQFLLNFHF